MPLSELEPLVADAFSVVVERQAGVDVSALQRRIRAEGEQLWDPSHQTDNVPIQRAGHDKWGIGKVVFVFCDDYISRVYTFPWFHAWKDELEPVFQQIQIPLERVRTAVVMQLQLRRQPCVCSLICACFLASLRVGGRLGR